MLRRGAAVVKSSVPSSAAAGEDDGDSISAAACAEAKALQSKWNDLTAESERLKVAASLARNATDRADERTAWARGFASDFLELADGRPKALDVRQEEIAYELAKLRPAYLRACETLAIAESQATSRAAKALQPRQRAAVLKIAKAAEDLSRAMAEERELHAELAGSAPRPTSAFLPGCSPEIGGGFDSWGSPLSCWRRRMKSLGYLN